MFVITLYNCYIQDVAWCYFDGSSSTLAKWSELHCSGVLFDVSLTLCNITAPIGDSEDDVANDSIGNWDVSSFLIDCAYPDSAVAGESSE